MRFINFIEVAPPLSLQAFVEAFWYCRVAEPSTVRLLPTACSVVMTCQTPYGRGLVVAGPMSRAQVIQVDPGELRVGAWLRPGAILNLIGHKPEQLRDSKFFAGGINCAPMVKFERDLPSLHEVEPLVIRLGQLFEELVVDGLLTRDKLADIYLTAVDHHAAQAKVGELLPRLVSARQFRRRFKQATGFTPKAYMCLRRQQLAVESLKRQEDTITDIAATLGYADHAHFTRDFRSMVGVSPSELENEVLLK